MSKGTLANLLSLAGMIALFTGGVHEACGQDTTPPTIDPTRISISFPDPAGNVVVNGLPGAVEDETPPINFTLTNIDSGDYISGTINPDGSLASILSGSVGDSILFYVTDGIGNWKEVVIGKVPPEVDTTPPIIEIISPTNGTTYNWNDPIEVQFTVSDPESGIAHSVAQIDSIKVTTGIELSADTLGYGNHIFSIRAVNCSGLISYEYILFKVDISFNHVRQMVDNFFDDGLITSKGIANSIKAKINSIQKAEESGNLLGGIEILESLREEINAQCGKHIDPQPCGESSAARELYIWAKYKTSYFNLALGIQPEIPSPLPYEVSTGSIEIWTPETGTIILRQIMGRYLKTFNYTADPNILEFTVDNSEVEFEPLEVPDHTIEFINAFPVYQSGGLINLSTGLIEEVMYFTFYLLFDGIILGPYNITLNLNGVLKFPDVTDASISTSTAGYSTFPTSMPLLGGALFSATQTKYQRWVADAGVYPSYKWNEKKGYFEVKVVVSMTECANRNRSPAYSEVCPSLPDHNTKSIEEGKKPEYDWVKCTVTTTYYVTPSYPNDPLKPPYINVTGHGNPAGPEKQVVSRMVLTK